MNEPSAGPEPPAGNAPPRLTASEAAAGILAGMSVAGMVGGLVACLVSTAPPRRITPEPAPGWLTAEILGTVALGGALAGAGGAWRGFRGGAVGCAAVPFGFLVVIMAGELGAGRGPSLGFLWWLPLAVAVLLPVGAVVGGVASASAWSLRQSRWPGFWVACHLAGALLVYSLAGAGLYAAMTVGGPDPAPSAPAPSAGPTMAPTFPGKMQDADDPPGKPSAAGPARHDDAGKP